MTSKASRKPSAPQQSQLGESIGDYTYPPLRISCRRYSAMISASSNVVKNKGMEPHSSEGIPFTGNTSSVRRLTGRDVARERVEA